MTNEWTRGRLKCVSYARVCLAGVFASLARDVEEAGRIMSFMQHKKIDNRGAWQRAITFVSKVAKDDETAFVSKHGSFHRRGLVPSQSHSFIRST